MILEHLTGKERYERRLARERGVLDVKPSDLIRPKWPDTTPYADEPWLLELITPREGWQPANWANLLEQRAHDTFVKEKADLWNRAVAILRKETSARP